MPARRRRERWSWYSSSSPRLPCITSSIGSCCLSFGGSGSAMRGREAAGLTALASILGVAASLWAVALWPLPPDAPLWLARPRAVCFGTTSSGLPDASGWLVMTVQPGIMLSILVAGWGPALAESLRWVARGAAGRASLLAVALSLALGLAGDRAPPPPLPPPRPTRAAPWPGGSAGAHGFPGAIQRATRAGDIRLRPLPDRVSRHRPRRPHGAPGRRPAPFRSGTGPVVTPRLGRHAGPRARCARPAPSDRGPMEAGGGGAGVEG